MKKKTEKLGSISLYDIHGTLEEVTKIFKDEIEYYAERSDHEYDKVEIKFDRHGDPYSDTGCVLISGTRKETKEEKKERLAAIKKRDEANEEREKALLVQLKEKYEDPYPY